MTAAAVGEDGVRVAIAGSVAREGADQHHPERVDIGGVTVVDRRGQVRQFVPPDREGEVGRGQGGVRRALGDPAGESQVGEAARPPGVDEDVDGRDVAVGTAGTVDAAERGGDLDADAADVFARQGAVGDAPSQGLAPYQLHDQVRPVLDHPGVHDLDEVRVRDPHQVPGLGDEAFGVEWRPEETDGDRPIVLQVEPTIDVQHRPAPHTTVEAIATL